MATITKFTVPVTTTNESSEGWISWIDQAAMPDGVRKLLRQKDAQGQGWAWAIRLDRWISPEGEEIDRRHVFLAYNDATAPALVSAQVDYSAWDD